MANITELNIDAAKANVWAKDVYRAIDESNTILAALERASAVNPNEEDYILNKLNESHRKLSEHYKNLHDVYNKTIDKLESILQQLGDRMEEIGDKLEELKDKIFG